MYMYGYNMGGTAFNMTQPYTSSYQNIQNMNSLQVPQNSLYGQYNTQNSQMNTVNFDFSGLYVKSYDDVKMVPVPMNGTVVLVDTENSVLYFKSIDSYGRPLIKTFNISESTGDDKSSSGLNDKYAELSKRVAFIEKNMNKNNSNKSIT